MILYSLSRRNAFHRDAVSKTKRAVNCGKNLSGNNLMMCIYDGLVRAEEEEKTRFNFSLCVIFKAPKYT